MVTTTYITTMFLQLEKLTGRIALVLRKQKRKKERKYFKLHHLASPLRHRVVIFNKECLLRQEPRITKSQVNQSRNQVNQGIESNIRKYAI